MRGPGLHVEVAVLVSSQPSLLLEYLRVAHELRADQSGAVGHQAGDSAEVCWCTVRRTGSHANGATVRWPWTDRGHRWPRTAPAVRRFLLAGLTLHARVLPAEVVQRALDATDLRWTATQELTTTDGAHVGAVWQAENGSLLLPFDPDEVITGFWAERYADTDGSGAAEVLKASATRLYYRLRPVLPRSAQLAARRWYSRVQARRTFPAWPVEESLHGFYELVLQSIADAVGAAVPWIGPWPNGRTWALVLTHDVETACGLERLETLRRVELQAGYRSSWNFVPGRYDVPDTVVEGLRAEGFEVGVHGLYHDGRDLESPATLGRRLPAMREHASRWGAVGFRSPATHRGWDIMQLLPFQYDSSYPDTDPFEPQPGGCGSWLPYPIGDLVELPITLPQDHTLFLILRRPDGRVWLEKAERIRERGGMALIITHPDYLSQGPIEDSYEGLLTRFADDPTAWRALPRDVNDWWRRRSASRIVADSAGWRIVGPAASEGTIAVTAPSTGAS